MSEQAVNRIALFPSSLLGTHRAAETTMCRIARRAWRQFDWQHAIEQEQLVEFIHASSEEIYITRCYGSDSRRAWRLDSWNSAMTKGFEHGGRGHDTDSPEYLDRCIAFILSGMQHLWYTLATLACGMQPVSALRFVAGDADPAKLIVRRAAEDFAEMLRWHVHWLPEILALKDRLRPTTFNYSTFILVAATRSCGVKFTAEEVQHGDAASLLLERGVVERSEGRFMLTPRGQHVISPAEEAALFPHPVDTD